MDDDPRTRFAAGSNAAYSRLLRLGNVLNELQKRHDADPTNATALADIGRLAERLQQVLDDFPAPSSGGVRR